MNLKADKVKVGSDGLTLFPFGNGNERMFNNKNRSKHLYRATLEGIAFSFVYGMELLVEEILN